VKDPAAVKLGRRGGLKSAEGRMEKMTPEQRSDIASAAAKARWEKWRAAREEVETAKKKAAKRRPSRDAGFQVL
jgi:hypothetical protein